MKTILRRLIPSSLRPHLRQAYFKLRGLFHRGDKVECPVCGRRFGRFITHGLERLCPGCVSSRRQRLKLLYLRRETDLFREPFKVLHIAPDLTLHRLFHRQPNLDYTSLDLHRKYVDRNGDLTDLPDPAGSYDALFCFHVLEHIPDDRKAMREIRRVLKPDGWALIQVPHYPQRGATYEDFSIVSPAERKRHFGQWDHVRVYGNDFEERLEESGFRVRFIDYAAALSPAEAVLYGVNDTVGFHLCVRGDA